MVDSDTEIQLPQTESALTDFFNTVIGAGNLPDDDFMRDMIATHILHAPQDRSWFKLSYFIEKCQKSVANRVAYEFTIAQAEKRKAAQEELKAASQPVETSKEEVSTNVSNQNTQG